MGTFDADSERLRPVERFKPTNGFVMGYAGLALVVLTIGYLIVSQHTLVGLRVGLASALFGVVVWVTQVRPRAAAYPRTLLLRNALRDVEVPLGLVDDVSVRQTLNVWVGDERYVCIGIGNSVRSMVKTKKKDRPSMLGASRWHEFSERAEKAAPDQTAMSYTTWVTTRIEELVEKEKKEHPDDPQPPSVHRSLAWPEVVALTVLGLAFVVSLML
jgi:uncharacterized short protein YbdD (DUF466 family)